MNFQKTTLLIAFIVFFIVCLIIIAILWRIKIVWPPEVADCPDFWLTTKDANGNNACQPNANLSSNLGNWGNLCQKQSNNTYNCLIVKQSDIPGYNSKEKKIATAAKCKWARTRGVQWSGVTDVLSSCGGAFY